MTKKVAPVEGKAPKASKVTNPFINEALKDIGKTEQDVITESVVNFLKEASIECKTQISERKVSQIPLKELALERATNELEKSKANLERAKVAIPSNKSFESYMSNLYNAERKVKSDTQVVDAINQDIDVLQKEVAKLEEVLARFSA